MSRDGRDGAGELRGRLPGVLVAFVAGLVGAALAQQEHVPCACGSASSPAPAVLPEVQVVAGRLHGPR